MVVCWLYVPFDLCFGEYLCLCLFAICRIGVLLLRIALDLFCRSFVVLDLLILRVVVAYNLVRWLLVRGLLGWFTVDFGLHFI